MVELSEIPMLSTIKWNITAYGDYDQMEANSEFDYEVPLKNTDLKIHFKRKIGF